MHKAFSRCVLFAAPLVVAAWAGCTDQTGGDSPMLHDAGPETTAMLPDRYVPPVDATVDAGRDCATDKQADGVQQHLDCTGLYSDFAAKIVASANTLYKPSVEFWSDGAEKSRFFFMPAGAKIDISNFDEWVFPNGTKIWKEFKVGGKRIETRMYFKTQDSWHHTSYRWNDAETDAIRKDAGEKVVSPGTKPAYQIPNTFECDSCHMGRREPVLGIEAVQLGLPGATGITLATLAAQSRFNMAPPVTTFTLPDDGTTKAAPALAWLHANCGQCHNNSDNANAPLGLKLFFLLRPSQLLAEGGTATVQDLDAWKTAVGVNASRTDVDAGAPYVRIVKGDPSTSLVSILSGRRVGLSEDPSSDVQMPPLVTRVVDSQGHALLDAWITAIPP